MTRNGRKMNTTIITTRLGESVFRYAREVQNEATQPRDVKLVGIQ